MIPCKICSLPKAVKEQVESLIGVVTYEQICAQINAQTPEANLNGQNITNHKNHMARVNAEALQSAPIEITEEMLKKQPDLVAIVDREIVKLTIIEGKRELTPAEQSRKLNYLQLKRGVTTDQIARSDEAMKVDWDHLVPQIMREKGRFATIISTNAPEYLSFLEDRAIKCRDQPEWIQDVINHYMLPGDSTALYKDDPSKPVTYVFLRNEYFSTQFYEDGSFFQVNQYAGKLKGTWKPQPLQTDAQS